MKGTSLGQLALKGGTALNQLPIGLHVKILTFNARFEAYWAPFGMPFLVSVDSESMKI